MSDRPAEQVHPAEAPEAGHLCDGAAPEVSLPLTGQRRRTREDQPPSGVGHGRGGEQELIAGAGFHPHLLGHGLIMPAPTAASTRGGEGDETMSPERPEALTGCSPRAAAGYMLSLIHI